MSTMQFHPVLERRPRMLKDFLSENSSSGFKSFSRKPISTTMRSLIEMESRNSNPRILSRSSKSAFEALINAVKSISTSFTTVNSPSMLPRTLSRKLSKKISSRRRKENEIKITVRIKDIIRWRSFRDLAEEEQPPPLDFSSSSPHRCTTAATTTTTATSSCSSSNGSSWSDSDFTSGYLSSCDGNFMEVAGNDVVGMGTGFSVSSLVGKDSVDATTGTVVRAKEDLTCQEEELQSPVSVLQIGEDEFSPFDQSFANIERKKQKFMQTIQRFESLTNLATLDKCSSVDDNISSEDHYDDVRDENEEQESVEKRARQLLHCVKANCSLQCSKANLDQLLLDFFRDELRTRGNYQTRNGDGFEWEILRIAEDWIDGSFEYDIEHDHKDACIRDMDRRGRWSKFEEKQEELAWEIETTIFENLVVELLNGFS